MSTRLLDRNIIYTEWSEALQSVTSMQTNIVVTDSGEPVAALVSYQDFALFQRALEQIQSLRANINNVDIEPPGDTTVNIETKTPVNFETAHQEVEAIQQLAKQIGENWSNPKSSLEILEEMREESSCR